MNHLSEEQFSGLLLQQGNAATRAHLAACAECRVELERVRESLASFNTMSLEWAERRSATLGPVRIAAAGSQRLPLVWATAALLVVGVFVGGMHLEQQRRGMTGAANVPAAASSVVAVGAQQQTEQPMPVRPVKVATVRGVDPRIAEDNRLLAAIDRELNSSEPLLVPISELRTAGSKAQRRLND